MRKSSFEYLIIWNKFPLKKKHSSFCQAAKENTNFVSSLHALLAKAVALFCIKNPTSAAEYLFYSKKYPCFQLFFQRQLYTIWMVCTKFMQKNGGGKTYAPPTTSPTTTPPPPKEIHNQYDWALNANWNNVWGEQREKMEESPAANTMLSVMLRFYDSVCSSTCF